MFLFPPMKMESSGSYCLNGYPSYLTVTFLLFCVVRFGLWLCRFIKVLTTSLELPLVCNLSTGVCV